MRDTSNVVLRAATAADAEHVARLLEALDHPTLPEDIPVRLTAIDAEGGLALLAIDTHGDAHGDALGFMSVARHAVVHAPGPVALITALVVAESARGRGVGRALVEAAKAWAAEQRCVRLIVTSAERRADAHAFYPACDMPYTGRRFATSITPTCDTRDSDPERTRPR